MNAQEFMEAVEGLFGTISPEKFVQEDALSYTLKHPLMTVFLKEKFLGGFSVFLVHGYSDIVQPETEELGSALERITHALDRLNADWSSYENYANRALEEFKTHAKMQLVYTPCISHFLPGYHVTAPGMDLVLATVGTDYRGNDYVRAGRLPDCGTSVRAFFGPVSSRKAPGIYALKCVERDNVLHLSNTAKNRSELAEVFKEPNVETRIRTFAVNRVYEKVDDLDYLPDCTTYDDLLGRYEYTFVEFDVYH